MNQLPWSTMSYRDATQHFQSRPDCGLSSQEASSRLHKNGHNVLAQAKKVSPVILFLYQFRDFMVLVLLAATLLSAVLGEYTDAIVIIGIVIVNAILGFVQEYRAEQSLEALREMTAPMARAVRDGVRHEIPAEELVPGDLVILEAGDRIPADIRLGEVRQFAVNEAPLTGESEPVQKQMEVLDDSGATLGDRYNMAFMGTMAVNGRASGIVVATGMNTEMGRVAHLIQGAEELATPLQKRLEQMGHYLVGICVLVCVLVVLLGLSQGLPAYRMFMAGISLAVAAIPEGLPAVVTIALAIGVQRMVRKNAVVRRLPAVETLGCATVICSDKTGTLTQNKMNVREVWTADGSFHIEGDGYSPQGQFVANQRVVKPEQDPGLVLALTVAILCNNAELRKGPVEVKPLWRGSKAQWNIYGDPTEGALLVAGARAGLWRQDLERQVTRIAEAPFDGIRKRMSVLYTGAKGPVIYVKGAPEMVLARCTHIYLGGNVVKLTQANREIIDAQNETMAAMALRNLALAYKPVAANIAKIDDQLEENLIFVGLIGMMDPPRPEVLPAIKKCHTAGIKTVMITGDHKTTAMAIARMLRMLPAHGKVLTGLDLDSLSENQLEQAVENTYVYARVTPEHKLRIVRALKRRGHIVGMTGDGVNDAPAVKEADIGIAMGNTGTDVTREAAAVVLADDNFNTIVSAVEEGRSIYDNIRKFIRFLLACNTGEILTMLVAMLLGLPLPLRAIQILWINLVTDGLPAMALGVDPVEKGVMERSPRSPQEGIFSQRLWQKILGRGTLIGLTTVLVFAWSLGQGMELEAARTMTFATLIMAQLIYVFDCRSERKFVWQVGFFSNPLLIISVLLSFGMLLVVMYYPPLAIIFEAVPLQVEQWMVILAASVLPTVLNFIFSLVKVIISPRVAIVKK